MSKCVTYHEAITIGGVGVNTRDWYAWSNLRPSIGSELHVFGQVQVPNPGVDPVLRRRVPQDMNPRILLLDLVLIQRQGVWPQVTVRRETRYDHAVARDGCTEVTILCDDELVVSIPVDDVE